MIRGIVLDLDDTLYEYSSLEPGAREAAEQYAERILKIEKSAFQRAVQIGKEKVKRQLLTVAAGHSRILYYQKALEELGYIPLSAAFELEQIYWKFIFDRMRLREGAEELLNLVKGMDWKIGICTDLTAGVQLQKIRILGLERWIDCIVTSEEAGVEKPHPEIFRLCLEKMGLNRNEVFLVGDNFSRDIEGAKKAGIWSIWYKRGETEKQTKEYPVIQNFSELRRKIEDGIFKTEGFID